MLEIIGYRETIPGQLEPQGEILYQNKIKQKNKETKIEFDSFQTIDLKIDKEALTFLRIFGFIPEQVISNCCEDGCQIWSNIVKIRYMNSATLFVYPNHRSMYIKLRQGQIFIDASTCFLKALLSVLTVCGFWNSSVSMHVSAVTSLTWWIYSEIKPRAL